jgi:hypothetical protein
MPGKNDSRLPQARKSRRRCASTSCRSSWTPTGAAAWTNRDAVRVDVLEQGLEAFRVSGVDADLKLVCGLKVQQLDQALAVNHEGLRAFVGVGVLDAQANRCDVARRGGRGVVGALELESNLAAQPF